MLSRNRLSVLDASKRLLMALAAASILCMPVLAHAFGEVGQSTIPPLGFVTRGPTTFGMLFKQGDIPHQAMVTENVRRASAQVDTLLRWPDGSLKFARITVKRAGHYLVKATKSASTAKIAHGTASIPDFSVTVQTNKGVFHRSLKSMPHKTLSCGQLLCLYSFASTPLSTPAGKTNHLLAIRAWVWSYPQFHTALIVATVENIWAQRSAGNVKTKRITYSLNNKVVSTYHGITIWRWSRTRPVRIWTGPSISDHAARNLHYLRATGAVPSYDLNLKVTSRVLKKLQDRYKRSGHGLMGHSIVTKFMPETGGREDIGPLPSWDVFPLLTNNPLALTISREVDDSSAVWPIHLRSVTTGEPLSIAQHPYATIMARKLGHNQGGNPVPCWHHNCRVVYPKTGIPLSAGVAHEPAMNYVPYLLTADPYYLEELKFWNNFAFLNQNPDYRKAAKGLFLNRHYQLRTMAWQLRTLSYLLFVLPSNSKYYKYWHRVLNNNRELLVRNWVTGQPYPEPVVFGAYGNTPATHRVIPPWEEDFLTWSIWNTVRLGNARWLPILRWNAAFVVHRLTDRAVCPTFATMYNVRLINRQNHPIGPWPQMVRSTLAQKGHKPSLQALKYPCRSAALARYLHLPAPGDFIGYPASPDGFPANMQPAVAAAVDSGIKDAKKAWGVYQSRPTKQPYQGYPNWDIVPWKD